MAFAALLSKIKASNQKKVARIMLRELKVQFLAVPPLLFILRLPSFAISSDVHGEADYMHSNSKHKIEEMNSKLLLNDIKLHGFILWASMGFLAPIGVLVMRMSKQEEHGRRLKTLLYIHAILQILAVLLVTAGAVMSIKKFENSFWNDHQRMGLALYALVWLQLLIALLRPNRGSKGRNIWYLVHWLLGTAVSILGVINIYTGLHAYHQKTLRRTRIWIIIFTAEISLIALFYVFQEKYIQKQVVILSHEPVQPTEHESPGNKKKEASAEPC